jgi:anti-anti-sigma factor
MSTSTPAILQLQVEKQPDVTIVHCSGKVLLDNVSEFSTVRQLIPEGKRIRVDLANVTQVDSTGIGTFVSVWAAAKKNGVELTFFNPSKAIEDIVEITKLHHMFEAKG